ncbi:hypothetical protein VTL71DRAFT_5690 [Oculimacula yallundae]|uniref:Chromo domain-containing protein n=1 Tax=Oculimacula yallundae TaxID=86028 RepID=A0ABR4C0S5_9HELO
MYRIDIPRRVGESSRTPKRRRTSTSPVSSTPTPSSSAKRAGKKAHVKQKAVEEESEELYSVKAILKEEIRKGKVFYLIDWEDDKDTGKPYEPTWEPHNFVTPDIIAEWQKKALEKQRLKREAAAEELGSPSSRQPIRPAKRRKLVRRADIVGKGAQIATGEPELDHEGSQAESQEAGLDRLDKEIPDSYEEEGDISIQSRAAVKFEQPRVEIAPLPRDFDPSAYTVYDISSSCEASPKSQSQHLLSSSDPFQSSLSSQEAGSARPLQFSSAPETQPRQLSQTNFIWDEDIDEESGNGRAQSQTPTPNIGEISSDPIESSAPAQSTQTPFIWDSDVDDDLDSEDHDNDQVDALEVPDSQEPRDSSSYKPSETSPSKAATSSDDTTLRNTQTNTEASLEAIEFRNTQLDFRSSESNLEDSGRTESQHAQPASTLDQESHFETPPPTSAQVALSIQSQTKTQSISEPDARADIPHIVDLISGDASIELSDSLIREANLPVLRSQDHFTTARFESSQTFDKSSEPSSAFQTQLPRVSCEEESGELQGSSLERNERDESDGEDIEINLNLDFDFQSSEALAQEASRDCNLEAQPEIDLDTQISNQSAEGDRDHDIRPEDQLDLDLSKSYTEEVRDHDFEEQLNIDSELQSLEPSAQVVHSIEQSSQQHSEQRSSSNPPDWQTSQVLSQSQIRFQTTKNIQTSSHLPHSSSKGSQGYPIQIDSPQDSVSPEPEPEIRTSQIIDTQISSSSKSSGYSQASSHLPSPPVEDDELHPSIEGRESLGIGISSGLLSSSPINTSRRRSLSSSMEPSNAPVASAPASDATAILRAKMAAKRASRALTQPSMSPAPILAPLNQIAEVPTVTVQDPTSVVPPPLQASVVSTTEPSTAILPVADIPISDLSAFGPPAPIKASTIAESVAAAPIELAAPSPPTLQDPSTWVPDDEEEEEEEEEEELTTLTTLPLEPEVYEVPLPMIAYTRDIYVQRVKIYKAQLKSFLRNEVTDETLITEVRALLETLQTVCIHPGMLEDDPTQSEDSEVQAKWAENVSTKFIFLAEFLDLMKKGSDHVLIVAQPGQVLDELESILLYHRVDYSRADRQRRASTAGKFRVTIYPAGAQRYHVDPPSLIIAFDPSYQTISYLEDLRTHPSSPGRLIPLVSLVVTNSVEHVERCFNNDLELTRRLIKIASCIQQLMGRVGTWESEGHYDPPTAAKMIAEYMQTRPHERRWPLLPIPAIDGLDLSLLSSQTYSEEQPLLQPGKRQLELDDSMGAETPKRQRMTPIDGANNGEVDNSMVTDTVSRLPSIPNVSGAPVNTFEDDRLQVSASQRIEDLEAQLLATETKIVTLTEINDDLETRCKSFEDSIELIQPKYQEALNQRAIYERDNERDKRNLDLLQKRFDKKEDENDKLRKKLASVEAELSTARSDLATSSNPEAARFESLREELEKSQLETAREHKRYVSSNQDLEYMRSTFQASASTAAEHNRIVQDLEAELATFREKSTQDKVRIHEIQNSNENAGLRQENTQLKARLRDLERDYEKKTEELRIATANGRRPMRGASAPQSPKMGMGAGNQNSPVGPRARIMYGGGSSRGNSPAPGDVRSTGTAAGNAAGTGQGSFAGGTFGDPLFPQNLNQAPKGRWGDHLQ